MEQSNPPTAVGSNAGLGLLPEPMKDYPEPGERTYSEDALIAFGRQERAAERERCATLCEDISYEYQRREGTKYPELKTDAQQGASECAAAIRGA